MEQLNDVEKVQQNQQNQESPLQLKIDPYRWVILILFSFAEISVSILFMTCTPISVDLGLIYNAKALAVAATATLQMFLFPICTFPATYCIQKKGLSFTLRCGAIIVMAGVLLRCLVAYKNQFNWVVLGSLVCGIGRPFIINVSGDLTTLWFPPENRTKIMTLLNVLVTLSLGIGNIIPSIFFRSYKFSKDNEDSIPEGHKYFNRLLYFEAIFVCTFMLALIILFRSKKSNIDNEQNNLKAQFKSLCKNLSFLGILGAFSICFGSFKGFSVCVPYMVNPFGFGSQELAILAVTPIIGGAISTPMISKAYKKTGRFKPLVVFMQCLTIFVFAGLYFALLAKKLWTLVVATIILGFAIIPTVPLMIEWGCKVSIPISDSFAIGFLYSGATLSGALLGEIYTTVLKGENADKQSVFNTTVMMGGAFIIALILCVLSQETKLTVVQNTEDQVFLNDSKPSRKNSRVYAIFNPVDGVPVVNTQPEIQDEIYYNYFPQPESETNNNGSEKESDQEVLKKNY